MRERKRKRCQAVTIDFTVAKTSVRSENFSFKCHRANEPKAGMPKDDSKAQLFAVNALSFHPIHGTFSTAGRSLFAVLSANLAWLTRRLLQDPMAPSASGIRLTKHVLRVRTKLCQRTMPCLKPVLQHLMLRTVKWTNPCLLLLQLSTIPMAR